MWYPKEVMFINKLLASLKMNKCNNLDISDENIKKFMPIINQRIEDLEMFEQIDELRLLFSKDINENYTDFDKIIKNIDPLLAEIIDENLYIIMDNNTADIIIDSDEYFDKEKMLKLGNEMKEFMIKKEKVKIYENYK